MSEHTDLLPLRGPEEGGPAFDLVRRGYDRDQVDSHLAWLEERVQEAEQARERAEELTATATSEAERAREELEAGRPSWDALGDRIVQILTLAEEEGAEIRAARTREAEQVLAEARRKEAEADRLQGVRLRDAERQAAEIVRDAERQAQEIIQDAQQQALETERASSQRLAELSRQRDAVQGQLARLYETLASTLQIPREIDVTEPEHADH